MLYLGVAQLVARYLGVVEAASSSLVTQTKIEKSELILHRRWVRIFCILRQHGALCSE